MPLPPALTMRRRTLILLLSGSLTACASFSATAPKRPPLPTAAEISALRSAAETAYTKEDWLHAESAYRALATAAGSDGQTWFRLGNALFRNGKLEEAAMAYREAVNRQPGLARGWHNLGVVQLQLARKSLQEAMRVGSPDEAAAIDHARTLDSGLEALLRPDSH